MKRISTKIVLSIVAMLGIGVGVMRLSDDPPVDPGKGSCLLPCYTCDGYWEPLRSACYIACSDCVYGQARKKKKTSPIHVTQ